MKKIIGSILAIALFGLIATTASAQTVSSTLTQGEILSLTQSSIVKIYHQIGGKLTIPNIRLDIKTMALSVDDTFASTTKDYYLVKPDYVVSYKFDYTLDPSTSYGTGFIVRPDGYILTNAHVASDTYLEYDYLTQVEQSLIDDMIAAYNTKYPGQLDTLYPTDAEWKQIYDKLDADMFKLISNNSKFDSQLVVVPQSSTDTKLEDIFRNGLTAKIVKMEDDLFSEKNKDKDLALIKIEQNNLPALKIIDTTATKTGEKIFIWGFPSSAEFNAQDLTSPTLTSGIINAFKDSSDKSFKLLQTDAKISEGSSGSPILNEQGEVIGIITYSSINNGSSGDGFAWGIPSSFMLKVMKDGAVANDSSYYDNFSAGLSLMKEKKCKRATQMFAKVKNTNDKFSTGQYVQPYIDSCASLISSGQSIDSIWQEAWFAIKDYLSKSWSTLVVLITGIVVLVIVILKLMTQNKKEDTEIEELKTSFKKEEEDINKLEVIVGAQKKELEEIKEQPKV
jgi:S1-C subfamily serine protease